MVSFPLWSRCVVINLWRPICPTAPTHTTPLENRSRSVAYVHWLCGECLLAYAAVAGDRQVRPYRHRFGNANFSNISYEPFDVGGLSSICGNDLPKLTNSTSMSRVTKQSGQLLANHRTMLAVMITSARRAARGALHAEAATRRPISFGCRVLSRATRAETTRAGDLVAGTGPRDAEIRYHQISRPATVFVAQRRSQRRRNGDAPSVWFGPRHRASEPGQ